MKERIKKLFNNNKKKDSFEELESLTKKLFNKNQKALESLKK